MAKESRAGGYDGFAGGLANLGHEVSEQTIGNIRHRHHMPPAPERKLASTCAEFMCSVGRHRLLYGRAPRVAMTADLLRAVFIHLESHRVHSSRLTVRFSGQRMRQIAPNVTMDAVLFGNVATFSMIVTRTSP